MFSLVAKAAAMVVPASKTETGKAKPDTAAAPDATDALNSEASSSSGSSTPTTDSSTDGAEAPKAFEVDTSATPGTTAGAVEQAPSTEAPATDEASPADPAPPTSELPDISEVTEESAKAAVAEMVQDVKTEEAPKQETPETPVTDDTSKSHETNEAKKAEAKEAKEHKEHKETKMSALVSMVFGSSGSSEAPKSPEVPPKTVEATEAPADEAPAVKAAIEAPVNEAPSVDAAIDAASETFAGETVAIQETREVTSVSVEPEGATAEPIPPVAMLNPTDVEIGGANLITNSYYGRAIQLSPSLPVLSSLSMSSVPSLRFGPWLTNGEVDAFLAAYTAELAVRPYAVAAKDVPKGFAAAAEQGGVRVDIRAITQPMVTGVRPTVERPKILPGFSAIAEHWLKKRSYRVSAWRVEKKALGADHGEEIPQLSFDDRGPEGAAERDTRRVNQLKGLIGAPITGLTAAFLVLHLRRANDACMALFAAECNTPIFQNAESGGWKAALARVASPPPGVLSRVASPPPGGLGRVASPPPVAALGRVGSPPPKNANGDVSVQALIANDIRRANLGCVVGGYRTNQLLRALLIDIHREKAYTFDVIRLEAARDLLLAFLGRHDSAYFFASAAPAPSVQDVSNQLIELLGFVPSAHADVVELYALRDGLIYGSLLLFIHGRAEAIGRENEMLQAVLTTIGSVVNLMGSFVGPIAPLAKEGIDWSVRCATDATDAYFSRRKQALVEVEDKVLHLFNTAVLKASDQGRIAVYPDPDRRPEDPQLGVTSKLGPEDIATYKEVAITVLKMVVRGSVVLSHTPECKTPSGEAPSNKPAPGGNGGGDLEIVHPQPKKAGGRWKLPGRGLASPPPV